jgi:ferric-dicitrate binding protein FerR (iron transport regulator)
MRFFDFYKDFTAAQFADDDYFREWVLRPDESLERFWTAYADNRPEHNALLSKARTLVEHETYRTSAAGPLSDKEKTALKNEIFQTIGITQSLPKTRLVRLPAALTLAASLLLLVTAIWLLKNAAGLKQEKPVLLAERTGANEIKTILLPDSSVVILNAGSSLQFSSDLGSTEHREVWLEGNAFFNVKKDAAIRKFVVHSRSLNVTVLGTELNVDARSAAIEVTLVSGKVKVEQAGKPNDPAYLFPGYKASLDTLSKTISLSVANSLLYSAWTEGKWNFRHTSLEEIAHLISEYYGTNVSFHNEKSKRLSINAVIAVGPLQKLIPVLEQTLHLQMTLSGNRLVIE